MIIIFYFFAAVLVLLSFNSFRGGLDYRRFFKAELTKPRSDFTPIVTVIAPCRGIDADLQSNLQSLLELDYPAYEVIFVVDDDSDPAVPVITNVLTLSDAETQGELSLATPRLSGKNSVSARLIVTPKTKNSSQKVENLCEAVLHASTESTAFVFVDSDVRPSGGWLRSIVAPLADKSVGAATGYRWFISNNPTFASELRSVWNASIASALGPNTKSNFCWGGSMAIRRDTFERLDIRGKWAGTLSDDFAVTRAMNAANLPIVFVPQALTASIEDCSLGEMFEFTTRQMKITRVYATKLWVLSFIGSALFLAVMIAAWLIAILSRQNLPAYVAIATFFVVSAFSVGKSWLRLNAVKSVLTEYKSELERQFWTQNTLWLLTPAIFFYNSLIAAFSRRMTWRGTVYELKSPTETVIIAD